MLAAETAELEFWKLGVQYYAAARSAVQSGQLPVCGNLFHHAIEAFLKVRFSLTLSLSQVRKLAGKTGHELPPLWNAFKAEFPGAGLEQFDDSIADVQRFERLLYPDANRQRRRTNTYWKVHYSTSAKRAATISG